MKRSKVADVLSLAVVVAIIVASVTFAMLSQAKESTEKPAPQVELTLANNGTSEYGSRITLIASVRGITPPYTLLWQYNDGNSWRDLDGAQGSTYEYTLSEENKSYTYRVLVSAQDGEQYSRKAGTAQ